MNGVATDAQSSQCHWGPVADGGARTVASLYAARQIAVISSGPHTIAVHGARRSATLAEILASGAAAALSHPRNDTHDILFVQHGKVWLLLAAESYYKAGLEAKKHGTRYLAVYDTRVPGKRLDRFKWALEHTLTASYDFAVCTDAPRSSNESRPVQLLVPPLQAPTPDVEAADEAFADWANQFIEWVGLATVSPHLLAGGAEPAVDRAICDNYIPDDAERKPGAVSLTSGFFTVDQVQATWNSLQSHEWAVMSVQGFGQMPIARSGKPREQGELGYTLIKSGEHMAALRYVH